MIEVKIESIGVDIGEPKQRVITLKEIEGEQKVIAVWIGAAEADEIDARWNRISFNRPLTIDFLKAVITAVGVSVSCVVISDVEEIPYDSKKDVYYAKCLLKCEGSIIEVDCRPSDAIALAVSSDSPIFVEDELMGKKGMIVHPETGIPYKTPIVNTNIQNKNSVFSDSTLLLLKMAELEGKNCGSSYIGVGHLVLALIKNASIISILKNLKVDIQTIQLETATEMITKNNKEQVEEGLSTDVKSSIQYAIAEIKKNTNQVQPIHIMLGLMQQKHNHIVKEIFLNKNISWTTIYDEANKDGIL